MDLIAKIRAAFTTSPSLKKGRVVKVKQIGDDFLVYLVSPMFTGKTSLQHQRLVEKAMQETGILSSEEIRRIGLVRTLTPREFQAILKARKARLNGAAGKPKKTKDG